MQNKILLPKLKILPNVKDNIQYNNSQPLIRLSDSPVKYNSNLISTGDSKISFQQKFVSTSLQPKIRSSQRLQYKSSPEYFKKMQRYSESNLGAPEIKIMLNTNQKTNKIKQFDKINLIRQSKQKFKVQREMKSKYSMKNVFDLKKFNNKIKHTMTDSNYDNFNVGLVPITKSLRKIQPSHLMYNS